MIPKITETDIVKAKFKNKSKMVVIFIIVSNISVFFIPLYYNALIMSAVLAATAAFMFFSMIALTVEIIRDMLFCFCNSVNQFICKCCCAWQERRNTEIDSNSAYNHFVAAEDENDQNERERLQ